MSRLSITDLIVHTKTVTSPEPLFTQSLDQWTENPRVENSVITPVAMHPEGSNLIEAFLCLMVFALRGYSCLLFDLTLSAMAAKSMLTLLIYYFCQEQAEISKYHAYSNLMINHKKCTIFKYQIKYIVIFAILKLHKYLALFDLREPLLIEI